MPATTGGVGSLAADWAALRQSPSARGPQVPSASRRPAGTRWGRDAPTDRPLLSASDTVGDSMSDLHSNPELGWCLYRKSDTINIYLDIPRNT